MKIEKVGKPEKKMVIHYKEVKIYKVSKKNNRVTLYDTRFFIGKLGTVTREEIKNLEKLHTNSIFYTNERTLVKYISNPKKKLLELAINEKIGDTLPEEGEIEEFTT